MNGNFEKYKTKPQPDRDVMYTYLSIILFDVGYVYE